MNTTRSPQYRCPVSRLALRLEEATAEDGHIADGRLVAPDGTAYPLIDGIPDFTQHAALAATDAEMLAWYDRNADVYDLYLPLTFETFGVDEAAERRAMIDELHLRPGQRILETGCGSGRDSVLIAERLGPTGELYLQDLSRKMLDHAVLAMRPHPVATHFSVAEATKLPFEDGYFDAYFHFGGMNTFADIAGALKEAVRVTRPGGRIVIGDESMPEWLRETEFARILMNSNPHYRFDIPWKALPVEARDVKAQWIIGGVFYLISFTVGEGEPTADFDFEIPGPRGGTHRTRFYGQLEGVTPQAKTLALEAAARSGKSLHRWLTDTVLESAKRDLGPD